MDRESVFAVFEFSYERRLISGQRSPSTYRTRMLIRSTISRVSRISTKGIQNEKVRGALGRSLDDRGCSAQVDGLFLKLVIRENCERRK